MTFLSGKCTHSIRCNEAHAYQMEGPKSQTSRSCPSISQSLIMKHPRPTWSPHPTTSHHYPHLQPSVTPLGWTVKQISMVHLSRKVISIHTTPPLNCNLTHPCAGQSMQKHLCLPSLSCARMKNTLKTWPGMHNNWTMTVQLQRGGKRQQGTIGYAKNVNWQSFGNAKPVNLNAKGRFMMVLEDLMAANEKSFPWILTTTPVKKVRLNLPEETRPTQMLQQRIKEKTCKAQGCQKINESRPATYHNWFSPITWRLIEQAHVAAGWEMSPTRIVKLAKQRNGEISCGLTRKTVKSWIDRSGPTPRWSNATLQRIQNGNAPGH